MKLTAWIEGGQHSSKLAPPIDVDSVKQLIIRDELGQPLMILIQQTPDKIWLTRQGDADFEQALGYLGINPASVAMQVTKTDAKRDMAFP